MVFITECSLYLVEDVVTIVMSVFGVAVAILTFLSNLTMALYFRQLPRRPGGMIFYKAIIIISMVASLIGQPLETANTLLKTSHLIINLASNFFLFFLFCATYHCIAGLTFERYIAIKREGNKKRLEKHILTGIIFVLVVVMCIPKFYNLFEIIIARYHCRKPPPSWMTIIAMCTWLIYCSLSINFLTKKAIRFVQRYDTIRQQKLGKTQKTNIKRLKVTKRVWLIFSIVWIPYGVVNMSQTIMSNTLYEHLNAISRGIAFTSFTVLPWVYYFMDKNYAVYVKKLIIRSGKLVLCRRHENRRVASVGNKETLSQVMTNASDIMPTSSM